MKLTAWQDKDKNPVVPLRLALYGHPVSGAYCELVPELELARSRVPALFTQQRPWMFPLVTNNGDLVKHEPGYLHAGVAC